jgi:hypothetical protein
VKTSNNNYSSPIISLHTYTKDRKVITRTKTTIDPNSLETNSSNLTRSHPVPSSSTNTDKRETEEKVRCIPVNVLLKHVVVVQFVHVLAANLHQKKTKI